jgi:hypothetical protein
MIRVLIFLLSLSSFAYLSKGLLLCVLQIVMDEPVVEDRVSQMSAQ